jgi:hypothetical protein
MPTWKFEISWHRWIYSQICLKGHLYITLYISLSIKGSLIFAIDEQFIKSVADPEGGGGYIRPPPPKKREREREKEGAVFRPSIRHISIHSFAC